MSTYTNTNFAPPSPMGQMNVVNGMPTHQMQQQQQQQQTKPQIQQQPGITLPPPPAAATTTATTLNSGMSKFMPPAAAPTLTSSTILNGPLTRSLAPSQAPTSNLPSHLRPSGINGPLGSVTLTNGGGVSANSSRTASPSLSQQQQFTVGAPPALMSQQVKSPMSMAGGIVPPPVNFALPPPPSATTSTKTAPVASVGVLSGSMQNLSLNRTTNGPQQQQQQPQQQFSNNFQGNFKTSALNTSTPSMQPPTTVPTGPPPPSSSSSLTSPTSNVNRPLQSTQSNLPAFNKQPITQTTNAPLPPSTTNYAANMYGTTTAPAMMRPGAPAGQQLQNANYPVTSGAGLPPSFPSSPSFTSTAAMQQNQLNNNQQQFAQRKPMYPTAAQLPPMPPPPTQQSQQQQPYSQAYQQQPPSNIASPSNVPQPGTFNGQPSAGPLQYQSQPQPYVQQQPLQQQQYPTASTQYTPQLNVVQQGFSRLWGQDTIDLMQNRHILTPATLPPPKILLHNQFHESINCNPNIMRCTIAKIPESNSLLQKSRLPLGILIHPFRDINSLPVIQCPNIVRCRLCRTYINPFVYFVDSKMWKCNLCYRVNELPEDFQYDPATKTYGDVTRRPEVRSSTIEFIAPSEYMLRPPQPAIYLFLFDVSIIAQQSGYLENACSVLSKHLDDMPGDARTQVGFIAYNSQVHFYSMAEGYNQPHEMTLIDIDDPFLPRPDNLLVNLKECKELVRDLLTQLPKRYAGTHDPGSALGAALQVAYKLMQGSGGRITVFQTCLPNKGPGSLEPREDPNNRSAKDVAHLNPATDFYKRYALECSGYQIAVDLFLLNQQYSDMATISGISKHSGGCVHHFPLYQKTKPHHVDSFKQCFKRYLVRKIGFEAVMRIRCTRGLQVHTFHGNFFVRSTDLLSLPNVNPDAGYGMQISYEESLNDAKTICFQAALLYTNSEGERRIRVHTMCLPVTNSLPEVMHAADTEAIIGLLTKMAVDRSITSNVADAREAFINATADILNAFKIAQNLPSGQSGQLIAPRSLALMPLYILALLKHPAFRVGTSTRLDDRVFAMDSMKTLPLDQLMKFIYPEFYQIDALLYNVHNSNVNATDDEDYDDLPEVPRLQLSAEYLDSRSIFLLDCGNLIIIYVGLNVPVNILENTLGIKSTAELPDYVYGLPNVNSLENDILKRFIMRLNDDKPYPPSVQIIRDTSTAKPQFIEKLVDDRSESSLSYYEFLQHIRTQVK